MLILYTFLIKILSVIRTRKSLFHPGKKGSGERVVFQILHFPEIT